MILGVYRTPIWDSEEIRSDVREPDFWPAMALHPLAAAHDYLRVSPNHP
jgi:hypothetical protein